jgi:tetratricopeptide (TPR) repeat protein
VLSETIARDGAAAAVQQYRELRSHEAFMGRYDFGEWSVNELARTLAENGHLEAAIAMLEMNGEYYPASPAIDVQLGDLFAEHGERDKALARFRSALHKDPTNDRLKRRIAELEGKQ